MNKEALKRLVQNYSGGSIKFFDDLCDILLDLGIDWANAGEKEYGRVLFECHNLAEEITVKLASIEETYADSLSETNQACKSNS